MHWYVYSARPPRRFLGSVWASCLKEACAKASEIWDEPVMVCRTPP
jgi:hypothetical protein